MTPCSSPAATRMPGLLIITPPMMDMMPLTMAAEVPMFSLATTSAAVLKASMWAALPTPKMKQSSMSNALLLVGT